MSTMQLQYNNTGVTAGVLLVPAGRAIHTIIPSAGSAAAAFTMYDNTSASGTPIVITQPANQSIPHDFDGWVVENGLYVVVVGTGANLSVLFE